MDVTARAPCPCGNLTGRNLEELNRYVVESGGKGMGGGGVAAANLPIGTLQEHVVLVVER